jgi:hypothetical protein
MVYEGQVNEYDGVGSVLTVSLLQIAERSSTAIKANRRRKVARTAC